MEEEWTEWNPPLNICGGPIETERISFDCPAFDTISEYYSYVDQMPLYGEEEGDLEAYIREQAEICGLEEIFDGHFILQTFITREGNPVFTCLAANGLACCNYTNAYEVFITACWKWNLSAVSPWAMPQNNLYPTISDATLCVKSYS